MSQRAYDNNKAKKDEKIGCPMCGQLHRKKDLVSLSLSSEEIELKRKILTGELVIQENGEISKKVTEDTDKQTGEFATLGKRDAKDIESFFLVEGEEGKKSAANREFSNALDRLAETNIQNQSKSYNKLFHKEKTVEDPNGLFFRNVRHGLR